MLKTQGVHPESITTDKLASFGGAVREFGLTGRHRPGGMRENNRAENSHLAIRRRERKQQKFQSQGSAQSFLATHAPIYSAFNLQPHLICRATLRQFGPRLIGRGRPPAQRNAAVSEGVVCAPGQLGCQFPGYSFGSSH